MMKIDSSGDEKVGQINGFKLLLSAWLQSTIRIVNYYPDIRIIRISVSALLCYAALLKFCLLCSNYAQYLYLSSHSKFALHGEK